MASQGTKLLAETLTDETWGWVFNWEHQGKSDHELPPDLTPEQCEGLLAYLDELWDERPSLERRFLLLFTEVWGLGYAPTGLGKAVVERARQRRA